MWTLGTPRASGEFGLETSSISTSISVAAAVKAARPTPRCFFLLCAAVLLLLELPVLDALELPLLLLRAAACLRRTRAMAGGAEEGTCEEKGAVQELTSALPAIVSDVVGTATAVGLGIAACGLTCGALALAASTAASLGAFAAAFASARTCL